MLNHRLGHQMPNAVFPSTNSVTLVDLDLDLYRIKASASSCWPKFLYLMRVSIKYAKCWWQAVMGPLLVCQPRAYQATVVKGHHGDISWMWTNLDGFGSDLGKSKTINYCVELFTSCWPRVWPWWFVWIGNISAEQNIAQTLQLRFSSSAQSSSVNQQVPVFVVSF